MTMESLLFKTLMSLIAVVGLMMVVLVLYKKFFLGGRRSRQSQVSIDVLGHRMLQPKRSVYILKVMDTMVVVGVTEAGMQPLMELREPQQSPAEPAVPADDAAPSFYRRLSKAGGTGKKFPEYLQESLGAMVHEFKRARKSAERTRNDSGSVIWGTNFTL
jgi:flagellar biogenesis protein FliO